MGVNKDSEITGRKSRSAAARKKRGDLLGMGQGEDNVIYTF